MPKLTFSTERPPNPDGSPAGPTTQELSIGIPEDGTTDYRTLALQFRYDISDKDTMIIQLSSRALGIAPIGDLEDEIELDWAFYERRVGDNTSIKIGRILIPIGIFKPGPRRRHDSAVLSSSLHLLPRGELHQRGLSMASRCPTPSPLSPTGA